MKIQLDTSNKTIKVEENVKIKALIDLLKKILPNEWQDFTLQTHTEISYWRDPIIIREKYIEPYKVPWYQALNINKTFVDDVAKETAQYSLSAGVYNIEA